MLKTAPTGLQTWARPQNVAWQWSSEAAFGKADQEVYLWGHSRALWPPPHCWSL